MNFMMTQDLRPSAEYIGWYVTVARRFLSIERILHDLRQFELPYDVPVSVPPVAGVPRPAHMPDRRHLERRLRLGTRASRRQHVENMEHDEDDTYDEDCSNSQFHPSPSTMPSPYMTDHAAEPSHRYVASENMHASSPLSSGSLSSSSAAFADFQAELQACLHGPTIPASSTNQQARIEETVTYQTTTSDCYRPSLDQLDMNLNPMMASSYPMQMPQSPIHNLPSQQILGFDLLGGTPPSAATAGYIG